MLTLTEELARGWEAWRTEYELEEDVGPEVAGPLVAEASRAREQVARLADARRALAENERATGLWDKTAQGAISAARRPPVGTSGLMEAIAQLARDVESTFAASAERRQLQVALDAIRGKEQSAQSRRDSRRQEIETLLHEVGADDAAELEQLAARTAERKQLEAAFVDHDRQMRELAGIGDEADTLLAEARAGRVEDWGRRAAEISSERSAVADTISALAGDVARVSDERRQLERSSDLARIDTEVEQVSAEAADALAQFRAIKMAEQLIRDTLETFVRERQPAVLETASTWFTQVTDGHYLQIRQARREHSLTIESQSGRQLQVTELSRGTKEQLYLCLRLALAQDFAARGSALPLVMDDVLVNFSPDRAAAMAEVLVAASQTQQILIFTCHPTTRDLLIDAGEKLGSPVDEEELHRDEKIAPVALTHT